jgi:hypothetical protein
MSDLMKPEELEIGMRFRLTGDACNEAERENQHTYLVTNKDSACKLGAHLIVADEAGAEEEIRILPWVKVIKVLETA